MKRNLVAILGLLFLTLTIPCAFPQENSTVLGDTVHLNVNRIDLAMENDGSVGVDANSFYPNGSNMSFLFQGGIAVSGIVNGQLRVSWMAKSSLIDEFQPGPWGSDPNDPENIFYTVTSNDDFGSQAYIDWANAVMLGADFYDLNGDGFYDPNVDRPVIIGDKTVWCIYNDGVNMTDRELGTPPLGITVQQYSWGFDSQKAPDGDILYFKYRIINSGVEDVDSVYFSVWEDPDIGNYSDDLIGCDTTLYLGYVYNDGDDNVYGPNPPAFGIDLLQTPIVEGLPTDSARLYQNAFKGAIWLGGYRYVPFSSFSGYTNSISNLNDPNNAIEARNYQLGGKDKFGVPIYPPDWGIGGTPQTNPLYYFGGDPLSVSGWIDNLPNNKRFLVNTGPFQLAIGDTQDVVIAFMVSRGGNSINSVTELKKTDMAAQFLFDGGGWINIAVNDTSLPIDSFFVFDALGVFSLYGDTLDSVIWELYEYPLGSTAQITLVDTFRAILIPDLTGSYTVSVHSPSKPQYGLITVRAQESTAIEEMNTSQLPVKYQLFQNYPNPFNPSTLISCQLPFAGNVTLKVYDVLGREVSILVNEEKPIGSYEVEFNASHLASGIYFYKIQAGDFVQTKKMMLLK